LRRAINTERENVYGKDFLRISAVIMLLHGVGLIIGAFTQTTTGDVADNVAKFMMGATLCGILLVLLLAGLLWMLSNIKERSGIKLLLIVTMAMLILGIIEIIFFFPYIVSIVPAVLALIALVKTKENGYK